VNVQEREREKGTRARTCTRAHTHTHARTHARTREREKERKRERSEETKKKRKVSLSLKERRERIRCRFGADNRVRPHTKSTRKKKIEPRCDCGSHRTTDPLSGASFNIMDVDYHRAQRHELSSFSFSISFTFALYFFFLMYVEHYCPVTLYIAASPSLSKCLAFRSKWICGDH